MPIRMSRFVNRSFNKMYTFELKDYLNPRENINIIICHRDKGCVVHTHEFVELIFTSEGKATHFIDGKQYDVEAGDLLFVNYGQTHSFVGNEGYHYYNLLYVPEFFSEELINSENIYEIFEISLFMEFEPCRVDCGQMVSFRGNEYLEIKKLVEDMYKEFRQKLKGYRSVLNGYSRVLFSKILREMKRSDVNEDVENCINSMTVDILKYIDSRAFGKISLKEIAEQTFYNPSYLSRLFKSHYGMSLSEYIKEKRIREAARLLTDSELSNEEIMSKVGYTDRKQFYKHFKEIYNQTPAEFRKNSLQ